MAKNILDLVRDAIADESNRAFRCGTESITTDFEFKGSRIRVLTVDRYTMERKLDASYSVGEFVKLLTRYEPNGPAETLALLERFKRAVETEIKALK